MNRNLITRALLLRNLKSTANTVKQLQRNSSHGTWAYRMPPPPPSKKAIYLANTLGGLCWFWILYHIATEPEHIYGEWPYIQPSTYTDEELGIPADCIGPLRPPPC